ncbi:MAG: rhomboid-like protein [Mycobacterium sp.]
MLPAVWSRLARVRVTVIYTVALSVVMVTLVVLGPKVRDKVVRYASTNLHNLAHGRIGTLLGSAFVADTDLVYLWLPGLVCLLAAAELLWYGRRLATVFIVGHVGATILVAGGLVLAVESGWLPRSISRAADVGVSYGVMAVVGALTSAVPRRFKPMWFGWWLPAAAAVVVVSTDFTDIGHVVALMLGMVISTRLEPPTVWTRPRRALFRLGTGFGYAVLVHLPELMVVGIPASLLGVTTTVLVSRFRQTNSSARAAAQSARHDSGG